MRFGRRPISEDELDGVAARRHRIGIDVAPDVPHQEIGIQVLQRRFGGHPSVPPDADRFNDRTEFVPCLCEAIFEDARLVPGGDVHNNPGGLKILQSLREESGDIPGKLRGAIR